MAPPRTDSDSDPVLLIVGELRGRMTAVEGYVKGIDGDVKELTASIAALRDTLGKLSPGMTEIMAWKLQQTKREQNRRDQVNKAVGWLAGITLISGTTGYAFWDRIAAVLKAAVISMK